MGLARLVTDHRAALTYDLRKLGLRLGDIGTEALPYREALDLVAESGRETGSHLHANLTGFLVAGSQADAATILGWTSWINANRDVKKQREPIVLSHPWPSGEQRPHVTSEEHARLKAKLDKYGGFAAVHDRPLDEVLNPQLPPPPE